MARHTVPAKQAPTSKSLTVIIPCAGAGMRMKSHGPKALLPLNGENILERQVRIIYEVFPNCEIIVVVGFEAKKLRKLLEPMNIRMAFNPNHETTNVVNSIGLALYASTAENILVCYGDLVFDRKVILSLIGCNKSSVVISDSMREEEVGIIPASDNHLIRMAYGHELTKWAQIALFRKRELRLLKKLSQDPDGDRLFGFEVINQIIENNGNFQLIKPDGFITDIDSPKNLENLETYLTL